MLSLLCSLFLISPNFDKSIIFLNFGQGPFPKPERNYLCNFIRGHYEEHFCEIILNLDKWFRRYHLKKKFTDAHRPITIAHNEPLERKELH